MATSADIGPGDVLLFHGNGFVSWAIRKFDGTNVNHAAIALGEGVLGEAAGSGLRRDPIDRSVQSNSLTVVRSLAEPADMTPVLAKANEYVDQDVPYAYQQIVLLAILAVTRRIPMPVVARRLVRSALDHAAAALNGIIDSGSRLMICSEYVYRAYDEAHVLAPPDPYALQVLPTTAFAAPGQTLLDLALARPADQIPAPSVSPTFGTIIDPAAFDAAAEARLAPLVVDYAAKAGLEADLPDLPVDASFSADLEGEPAVEELLEPMVNFGAALTLATAPPGTTFGGLETIAAMVGRGALEGIRKVSADPNFVTPGDLLKTTSLVERFRLP